MHGEGRLGVVPGAAQVGREHLCRRLGGRAADADWEELVADICSTPWSPGEQLEAASPIDPSFWPIHPALDRLLHWKKIAQPFTDAGWADPDDPDATEYCMVVKDIPGEEGCHGHHAFDTTFFESHHLDASDGSFKYRTSRTARSSR